jgi:hypothetical protein
MKKISTAAAGQTKNVRDHKLTNVAASCIVTPTPEGRCVTEFCTRCA